MADPLTEANIAEAANAAAVAKEADHKAFQSMTYETLVQALNEVLVAGEKDNLPLLLRRVPFLCTSVVRIDAAQATILDTQEKMKQNQQDIKNDIKWLKWIGTGFVGAAGLLALKSLGL